MSHFNEVYTSAELNMGGMLDDRIRKRRAWLPDTDSLVSDDLGILDDDDDDDDVLDEEEEDGVGCPLPSTPEDNQLLEAEVFIY